MLRSDCTSGIDLFLEFKDLGVKGRVLGGDPGSIQNQSYAVHLISNGSVTVESRRTVCY
jgi:hypothetical protein